MEPISTRRKKNSPRANLVFSVAFHAAVVFVAGFWAAHEGVLGQKLKEITVALVPKEKPPEPPPPPPKIEPPREEPKVVETPKTVAVAAPPPMTAPPPAAAGNAPVAVAPAAASLPDFAFGDGAKIVETSTNAPVLYYKSLVEYALRSNWERPTDLPDANFVAEVEVFVDAAGKITRSNFQKGSGDPRWDASVKKAIAATTSISRPPPPGFPGKFLVRFDVVPATEPALP